MITELPRNGKSNHICASMVNYKCERWFISSILVNYHQFVGMPGCRPNDYELMIFPCDSKGNVTDWSGEHCSKHDSEAELIEEHLRVCDVINAGGIGALRNAS